MEVVGVAILPGRKMMMINFSPELGLAAALLSGRTDHAPWVWRDGRAGAWTTTRRAKPAEEEKVR